MNFRQWMLIIVSSGLLCACVPAQQANGPEEVDAAKTVPTISKSELPCAELRERFVGDELTVLYVSQNIYRDNAVLPTVEGLACLDVLADWLRSRPQMAWKVSVGSERGTNFEAQSLADKRQELLRRYFLRKGIDTAGWEWQSVPRHKVQLRLDELRDPP